MPSPVDQEVSMEQPDRDPTLRRNVASLIRFLRELATQVSRPVRRMKDHPAVIALDGSAAEAALSLVGDGEILRARRVLRDPPPEVPAVLHGRLQGDPTASDADPVLRKVLVDDDEPPLEAYREWRAGWDAWAAVDRGRRPHAEFYDALFTARQECESSPESIELVLAGGLLSLDEAVAGERIETHLVTVPARVVRDAETSDLVVAVDGEPCRLEDARVLAGIDVFDGSGTNRLEEVLATVRHPLDPDFSVFLKEWADRALTVPVSVGEEASGLRTLTAAPALVVRLRGAFALGEYYDSMLETVLDEDAPVPLGLAQLVAVYERADRLAWIERSGAGVSLPDDPLFPLPANPAQRTIFDRLAHDSGVVVEGPPGTGKTHTIANLVSALLAEGKRVLVTAEKAQALGVLREKLPPAVRELCVSVTDVGRGGSKELGAAVSEITVRRSAFDADAARIRIAALTARRTAAVEQRAALLEQLAWLRESETVRHPEIAPGYGGTLATIAARVVDRQADFTWFPGPVLTARPTITRPEFQRLRRLLETATPARAQRPSQLLDVDVMGLLPSAGVLGRLCDAACAELPTGEGLEVVVEKASAEDVARVSAVGDALAAALDALDRQPQWCGPLVDRILDGSAAHVWDRASDVEAIIARAVAGDRYLGHRDVQCDVEGPAAQAAYGALADALRSGREWKQRLFKSDEQKAVESLGPVATVDGALATSAESAHLVHVHLSVLRDIADAGRLLGDLGAPVDGDGSRVARVSELGARPQSLQAVAATIRAAADVDAAWRALGARRPTIASREDARSFVSRIHQLAVGLARRQADEALASLEATLTEAFGDGPSPESEALIDGLRRRDVAAVFAAVRAFDHARQECDDEFAEDDLVRRSSQGAPGLADALRADAGTATWDGRLARIDEAWAWRRAERWLADQRRPGRDAELAEQLALAERDIAATTEQLAGERAWAACLASMTVEQVEALSAYRGQVAKIGKGTGRYVEINRAAAREAMVVAQGAVPAWVMPLSGVLSSVPATANAFDVVIVDEASQANILNVFLLMLAPRVIVVGDDKQCVPGTVGFGELQPIFDRLDDLLPDLPRYRRNAFTPQSSLFSLLKERFGHIVRLQEHFRCMPEIISWSSNEFYRDAPLEPLRQFGSDRLAPLRATRVRGAVSEGRNERLSNRAEARAIVDAVERCIADGAYDGRTFGVVVLQGRAQVDVIRTELLTRLGPEEIESRRLRVGMPPDFQGDERDVIFVSMVVATNQRFMARTKADDDRRFNVAASRGRDQLWLFHSVTAVELSADDLRRRLLDHVTAAGAPGATPMPTGVPRDRRVEPFDSLFEQRVFLDIVSRGYHVDPQIEANGRMIDLVVTGSAGRLAVECDGDVFHTSPEQVRSDLVREHELQRAGWEFWRVRESEYRLDPVAALADLWRALDRRGIRPAGADDDQSSPEAPGTWLAVVDATDLEVVDVTDLGGGVIVDGDFGDDDGGFGDESVDDVSVGRREPLTVYTVGSEGDRAAVSPEIVGETGMASTVAAAPATGRLESDVGGPVRRPAMKRGRKPSAAPAAAVPQAADASGRSAFRSIDDALVGESDVIVDIAPTVARNSGENDAAMTGGAMAGEVDRRVHDLLSGSPEPMRVALVGPLLGLDMATADAALCRLRSSGHVEIVGKGRAARYRATDRPTASSDDVDGNPADDPREKNTWPHGSDTPPPAFSSPVLSAPAESNGPDLGSEVLSRVVVAMIRDRPVTAEGLVRLLHVPEADIRTALDDLVTRCVVTQIGDEYWRPDDAPISGRGDTGLAPAARSSARRLLAVATWGGPVTMERARTITRLPDETNRDLLDELVTGGVLLLTPGAEPSWVRR